MAFKPKSKSNKVRFKWKEEEDNFFNKSKLSIRIVQEEINKQQIDNIVKNINEKLSIFDPKATLDIKITETEESILTSLGYEKNQKFSIPLDWPNGEITIFYEPRPRSTSPLVDTKIDFFCGIKLEAKAEIPELTYVFQNEHKSLQNILNELKLEVKADKKINGIEKLSGYKMRLNSPSLFYQFGAVYLDFLMQVAKHFLPELTLLYQMRLKHEKVVWKK